MSTISITLYLLRTPTGDCGGAGMPFHTCSILILLLSYFFAYHKSSFTNYCFCLSLSLLSNPRYNLLDRHFEDALKFIDMCKEQGRRVLLHCRAGINRSAALAVAYYMIHTHTPLYKAVQHCVAVRPIILSNRGFVEQLVEMAIHVGLAHCWKLPAVFPPHPLSPLSLSPLLFSPVSPRQGLAGSCLLIYSLSVFVYLEWQFFKLQRNNNSCKNRLLMRGLRERLCVYHVHLCACFLAGVVFGHISIFSLN